MTMGTAPQDRTYAASDRPLTGSMLFPDLVWAHWVWQCKARPRRFERNGAARRLLASFARRNGRPPRRRNAVRNGGTLPETDLKSLEGAYEREAESFQSSELGFVERTGRRPRKKESAPVVARHRLEIDRIERYYDRAAKKVARIRYFGGMLLGLLFVAALGVLSAAFIELFGELDLGSASARNFYACFGAGALGAMVSVMTRMRQEDGLKLDYEVGPALIVMLGAFRPILGAIFGTVAYFALESDFLPLTPPPEPGKVFFYYPLIAFFAGFSERFAHVVLGEADLTVARALSGADTASTEIASNRDSAAARSANGAVSAAPAPQPTTNARRSE
jgi:hypothetical protein